MIAYTHRVVRRRLALALPVAVALTSGVAVAQVPPALPPTIDPGLITNENLRNRQQIIEQNEQRLQGPAVLAPAAPQSVIGPPGGAKFLLKSVVFNDSAFITSAELNAAAEAYVGKKVDISDVQRIVKAINDIYAARGIVTGLATLPPQDLKKGVLTIKLVEGRLGKIDVTGNKRLSKDFIEKRVTATPGAVVDVPQLTRQVSLFNRTGVAQVQASLQAGAAFGLTDIVLATIEPPAVSLNLFTDNQGVKSVGRNQGGFLLQGYAPLGIDDRLTLYGVGSDGNVSGNVAYSLPFNVYGGRIGGSYTQGQIRVIHGPFEGLGIRGQSNISSVNLTQPIYVDTSWYLLAIGSYSRFNSASTQMAVPITDNGTNKATGGFTVGYSGSVLSASVSPTYSYLQTDFKVTDVIQRFETYGGFYSASVKLPLDLLISAGGAYQISSAQFIAGDQLFQIGGPTTVRGYPAGFVAGASGDYTNVELHRPVTFNSVRYDPYVFYDHGRVINSPPNAVDLNSYGVGISIDILNRVVLEGSVGIPLNRITLDQPRYDAYFRVTTKFTTADLENFKLPTFR